jgi:hypothetical protein
VLADKERIVGAVVDFGDALVGIGKDLEGRLGSFATIEAVGVVGLRAHLPRGRHGLLVVAVEQIARDRLDLGLDLFVGRLLRGLGGRDEHASAGHRACATRKRLGFGRGRQSQGDCGVSGSFGGESARGPARRVDGRHALLLG